jgi:hypothetical protein
MISWILRWVSDASSLFSLKDAKNSSKPSKGYNPKIPTGGWELGKQSRKRKKKGIRRGRALKKLQFFLEKSALARKGVSPLWPPLPQEEVESSSYSN